MHAYVQVCVSVSMCVCFMNICVQIRSLEAVIRCPVVFPLDGVGGVCGGVVSLTEPGDRLEASKYKQSCLCPQQC